MFSLLSNVPQHDYPVSHSGDRPHGLYGPFRLGLL